MTRVSLTSTGGQAMYGNSTSAAVSSDGAKVVFVSSATNLVPGDTNGQPDIFLRNLSTNTTIRVSQNGATQATTPSSAPVISSDGNTILFLSADTGLVPGITSGKLQVFRYTVSTGALTCVTRGTGTGADGNCGAPTLSPNGQWAAFHAFATNLVTPDTNNAPDVFIVDLTPATPTPLRVSMAADGTTQANGTCSYASVSDTGRYVSYLEPVPKSHSGISGSVVMR